MGSRTTRYVDLTDLLTTKRCFKLVCGAGNEDADEVEKLVAVYAKAGANYFDLSAKENIVLAAKSGLERVIPKDRQGRYFLNVSVGIAGDPHMRKARIKTELCSLCGACEKVCLEKAIQRKKDIYCIIHERCIGCGTCEKICPVKAISFINIEKDLKEVLPPLIKLGIHSIELHAVTDDEESAYAKWGLIQDCFDGVLSLCLDRSHLGDKMLVARIKRFIANRKDYTTIVQADGAPMTGCDDRYNTTLQALGTADIVQKAKLPIWLLVSGGTNSKTTELTKLFEIDIHGVAMGSYARKIIKKYLERNDLLQNRAMFNMAYRVAKQLVAKSLKYLG